jgi:hypothetical protein
MSSYHIIADQLAERYLVGVAAAKNWIKETQLEGLTPAEKAKRLLAIAYAEDSNWSNGTYGRQNIRESMLRRAALELSQELQEIRSL